MHVTLIVAVAKNGVIGRAGRLPWHLSADLKRFKARTMGHPIVMGRKTFASIGKLLPGRTNIVITRDPLFAAEGVLIAATPTAALDLARNAPGDGEIFVIGGAEIYRALLPVADRIDLTEILVDVDGDTYFEFDRAEWRELTSEDGILDAKNALPWRVVILERAKR